MTSSNSTLMVVMSAFDSNKEDMLNVVYHPVLLFGDCYTISSSDTIIN